ncbi:MAG: hypothetical protein AAF208_04195 [Cyanobacteria bacterium P01_A01_bin.45]
MSILFIQILAQKKRLSLAITSLIATGILSGCQNTQLESKQLISNNLNREKGSVSISGNTSFSTASISNSLSTNQKRKSELENIENQSDNQQNIYNSLQLSQTSSTYQVIDELKNYKYTVNGKNILSRARLPKTKVTFNKKDLLTVLINTRKYFQDHSSADPNVLRKGLLGTRGVTIPDVLRTLDFMIVTLQEDIANNRPSRLEDPSFINENFRVIKWSAYNPKSPRRKSLRITKYAVFAYPGSRQKTSIFNIPLYSLKDDNPDNKFYTKYTKQDVLSGIYEPGGKEFGKVDTLAYLTREGLEEALMEGTVLVKFPNGNNVFFNVDRSNEIPYVKGLKRTAQRRYWYFREVNAIKGYGYKIDHKIPVKPGVTFAGDVLNIGLGKVIVMEYNRNGRKYLRMGVLADTGGAFLPNLYQLDFLAGIYPNKQTFKRDISKLPTYAKAYFLIKK